MFHTFKKALIASALGISSLSASFSDVCTGWDIGADFLWWKACENDADYAILYNDNPTLSKGNFIDVKHDWAPGYRLYAEKKNLLCNLNLYGSYTYFEANDASSIATGGGFLLSTLIHGGRNPFATGSIHSITARHKIRYQTFDVLLTYDCGLCCGQTFTPFFGLEGLKLNESWCSVVSGTIFNQPGTDTIGWCSNYEALGLKVGAEYAYELSCGLNMFVVGSLSLLAGCDSANNVQLQNGPESAFIQSNSFKENPCLCTPGAHIGFGFSYEKCWCGKTIDLRIGYEFVDWWNVPTIRRFAGSGTTVGVSTSSAGANLTLHGLFAGLSVGF